MRRLVGLVTVFGALALVCGVPAAQADGGPSISAATPVVVGQLMTGNTATGSVTHGIHDRLNSYWTVAVNAGDQVTINWTTRPPGPGYGANFLEVWPVGTNDFTQSQTDTVAGQNVSSNGNNQLKYQAPLTGNLPIRFSVNTGSEAPYSFTVLITPAVPASCPAGQTGTPPNCATPPPATCPAGQTGTPPNCTTPRQPSPASDETAPRVSVSATIKGRYFYVRYKSNERGHIFIEVAYRGHSIGLKTVNVRANKRYGTKFRLSQSVSNAAARKRRAHQRMNIHYLLSAWDTHGNKNWLKFDHITFR